MSYPPSQPDDPTRPVGRPPSYVHPPSYPQQPTGDSSADQTARLGSYGTPPQPTAPYGQTGPVTNGPGQPTSATPYGQPTSATPYGQPTSATPYGQPTSATPYPMSGSPWSMPPAGGSPGNPRVRSGNVRLLVLAGVAGLLLVATVVLTGLFVSKSGALARAERTVAQRDAEVATKRTEIEGLQRDLRAANDKARAAEQDLTGTRNDRDEQQRQKEVISTCLEKLTEALASESQAEFDKNIKVAEKACEEAEKYL
ncbi:hypothetical protein [Plantactinospora sp. GCM10030261]|uniref:hypothetical protein n=1 Tax=Plantactinospora sp. GCM10030261 TaxID=3273420 RepID=UPI00360F9537